MTPRQKRMVTVAVPSSDVRLPAEPMRRSCDIPTNTRPRSMIPPVTTCWMSRQLSSSGLLGSTTHTSPLIASPATTRRAPHMVPDFMFHCLEKPSVYHCAHCLVTVS